MLRSPNIYPQWKLTRDGLQQCADLLGAVRAATAPKEKHWFHITLYCDISGLSTGVLTTDSERFSLFLDFIHGELRFQAQSDESKTPIDGKSITQISSWLSEQLDRSHITVTLDWSKFSSDEPLVIELGASAALWTIYSNVDRVFKEFRASLREETSPVHVWPHHFDLAMLWFSGRQVPDTDPADEENADEQMNFGFVPGDGSIDEPYFYITAYPLPKDLTALELPSDAYWHTEGFTGAILKYSDWVQSGDALGSLMKFLSVVHQAGKHAMLDGK